MEQHVGGLSIPDDEFFNGFVTWSALEEAMKGLRDGLLAERSSSEPVGVERTDVEASISNQTDPVSKSSSSFSARCYRPSVCPSHGRISQKRL